MAVSLIDLHRFCYEFSKLVRPQLYVADCQHYVIPPCTVLKKENSQKYKLSKTEGSWSLNWDNTYEGIEKNIMKVIRHLGFYYFF